MADTSSTTASTSAFQEVHDGLAQAETTVTYDAPTNSLPPGFGIGPSGSMNIKILPDLVCPGHEGGTIQLTYDIPTGPQRPYHPHPGVPYDGVRRRSYLPNTPEGRCLLTRYKYAFNHGHMFLVGHSVSKNKDHQVTWSTLPNHTTLKGTSFGFPDPQYFQKAATALAKLGIPTADDIVHPKAPDDITIRSLGSIRPLAPPTPNNDPPTSTAAPPCAVNDNVIPLPPPYLIPNTAPYLANIHFPSSWKLSTKEIKRCTPLKVTEDEAALKRLVLLSIPVEASEIVVALQVKDLLATTNDTNSNNNSNSNNDAAATTTMLQDQINQASVTRVCRAALLTRGSFQLKKTSMRQTGALLAAVADRNNPNIMFGLFDLRAVHVDRDMVLLAYTTTSNTDTGKNPATFPSSISSGLGRLDGSTVSYALYQTPEPNQFLSRLGCVVAAAYVSVPTWAVPIRWSGSSVPALQTITNQEYTGWMGVDGGFSSSLYAAALWYHVKHKVAIGKLETGPSAVTTLIMDHQPSKRVPTRGPQLLDLLPIAIGLSADSTMIHLLVEHGLHALAFNLVFRKLKLSKYRLPPETSGFRNALFKTLLYNVTLREIDLSGINLAGLGEGMGQGTYSTFLYC